MYDVIPFIVKSMAWYTDFRFFNYLEAVTNLGSSLIIFVL